jgi:tetratricopeptide (TPR) repeat protein
VEVKIQNGFARLIFKWEGLTLAPRPPAYTVDIENGVLVLRFAQAYNVDLDLLVEQTEEFIALIRQDADKKTLRMALKDAIRIQSNIDDLDFAVDIIPLNYEGDPAPHAAPRPAIDLELLVITAVKRDVPSAAELRKLRIAAKPIPLDAPRLPVRVIRNDTRSRVVFQWPETVGYDIVREGNVLVANFNKIARPALARLRIDPPKFVKAAEAVKRFGGLEVRIEVDPNTDFIHFRQGSDVVIDILAADAIVHSEATTHKETPTQEEIAAHDEAADPDGSEAHEEPGEHAEPEEHVVASADHKVDAEHVPPLPSFGKSKHETREAAHSTAQEVVAVDHSAEAPHGEHAEATHVQAAHEPDAAAEDPVGHAEESGDQGHAAAFTHVSEVHVDLIETDEGVEIVFPWGRDVAAAVFKRGDHLWVIFDAVAKFDLSKFKRGSHYEVGEVADYSTSELTFLRMELGPRALVMVKAEHHAWRLLVGETTLGMTQNIELVTDVANPGQARIYADMPSANSVHHITDPEVGDDIIVVTALGPVQGMVSSRKFVDFMAMATSHGIAIQPIVEDLDVSIKYGFVSITKVSGLAVTGAISSVEVSSVDSGIQYEAPDALTGVDLDRAPVAGSEIPGFVDFVGWAGNPDTGYYATLAILNDELSKAPKRAQSMRRLDLARFYFAHNLLAEAIGVLNSIAQAHPVFALRPQFVSLKGATQHRMHRNKLALETLSHGSVKSDPGAAIWRGMALEELDFHKNARRELALGMKYEDLYPKAWRARFQLAETKAALGVRELEDATIMWENIHLGDLSDEGRAEAYLVQGKMLREYGEPALALEFFRRVFPLTDGEMAHRSRYNEVTMLYDVGEMEADEAIDRLERLRYQWRGDDLELRTMRSLGKIYVEEERYRDALSAMRFGSKFKPQHPVSRDMRNTMSDVFETLFLDGKADTLKMTSAIALFYDFKELTPLGAKGDRMIRLLTERLVSIGLLDQAAELLDHQVKYRLKGTGRSQVAMRLALIQLRNKQPKKAFSAISSTRFAGLTPKLRGQRRLIEARALADMGRHDHAIELLEDDITQEAETLRANIYWDADNWPETGRIYEELLEDEWGTDKDLSNEARTNIMRMSIAYALVDDKAALQRVRRKFSVKMMSSPDAQAFNIATGDLTLQGAAFRDVLRQVNSIDTFEAFMSDFKSRFGDEGTMVN